MDKNSQFRHKKSLGQHFLKDKNIIRKIVSEAGLHASDKVWEIGPGKGILTEELLNQKVDLTCFEIDHTLWEYLEETYGDSISLIKGDVLKQNWEDLFEDDLIKVVANLPYQITSPFLFKVIKYVDHFESVVLMIQKEVAERINAKTGSKTYGLLSIKMQFYFNCRYSFTVKPHLFNPPPKVDSAVIKLIPREDKPDIDDEKMFWRIVDSSFRNRRKMLRKNLREILNKDQIETLGEISKIELTRRGETLNESEYVILYNDIKSILN